MSGAANRENLVSINWYITKNQDSLLNRLQLDGRSRSEHVRNAIDAFLSVGGFEQIGGDLVKAEFNITKQQKQAIEERAAYNQISAAEVLRNVLHHLEKKHC